MVLPNKISSEIVIRGSKYSIVSDIQVAPLLVSYVLPCFKLHGHCYMLRMADYVSKLTTFSVTEWLKHPSNILFRKDCKVCLCETVLFIMKSKGHLMETCRMGLWGCSIACPPLDLAVDDTAVWLAVICCLWKEICNYSNGHFSKTRSSWDKWHTLPVRAYCVWMSSKIRWKIPVIFTIIPTKVANVATISV